LLDEDGINPCDAKKGSKDQRCGRHPQLTLEVVALNWQASETNPGDHITAAPMVRCAGCMDLRSGGSAGQPEPLRHQPQAQPLITMGFRFRRSARLGPLRFNFAKGGLSSISVGGRGASFNIPVARSGGARTTVGLPGTGLSWSVEHSPDRPAAIPGGTAEELPNSRRLRPGQLDALKHALLGALRQELFSHGSPGEQLWDQGLVSRLLADGSLGARTAGLLALIETPEALENYLLRAQGQDDAKRRAQRCITAVQEAVRQAAARGWRT
jgi:hypothetical protein